MADQLQESFRALSDPTRRQILVYLSQQDMTIAEVAEQFSITRAAVKKHLTVLQEGKLISVRSSGRERINQLEPHALKSVTEWFSYFDRLWDNKLSNLKHTIENDTQHTTTTKRKRKKQ